MVLWCVHAKNTPHAPLLARGSFSEKVISWKSRNSLGFSREEDGIGGVFFEIRLSKRRASKWRHNSVIVKALANRDNPNSSSFSEDGDPLTPGGDGKGKSSDGNEYFETASQKSKHVNLDWREVRAALFRQEQAEKSESDAEAHNKAGAQVVSKWAHPIAVPETGCVLVATEMLDGVRAFERTVVLLLRSGTRHLHEGPFGVVINRPLPKKMKHMKPTNLDLATTFADCTLHFGGPLEASMFLLNTRKKSQKIPGFEEVTPGLRFGARHSLHEAAGLVKEGVLKAQDFRFFVGYAGWQLDQLREEIELGYWYVAACSLNLISRGSDSSESLWYEILQLMGGQYSELSRKPKKDM